MKMLRLNHIALNLGGFISLMGGISLMEKGAWSAVGVVMSLVGFATLVYAFYTLFMERKFEAVSQGFLIKVNAISVVVLMAAHLIIYLKTGFNWPLHALLLLILMFLLYSLKFASGKGS